jgi:hypothetical protein
LFNPNATPVTVRGSLHSFGLSLGSIYCTLTAYPSTT